MSISSLITFLIQGDMKVNAYKTPRVENLSRYTGLYLLIEDPDILISSIADQTERLPNYQLAIS